MARVSPSRLPGRCPVAAHYGRHSSAAGRPRESHAVTRMGLEDCRSLGVDGISEVHPSSSRDMGGRPRANNQDLLSRPLATAYVAAVALGWLGLIVALVAFLLTGRMTEANSWLADNSWIVVPTLLVIAPAAVVVLLVEQRLHGDRRPITQPFRLVGLAFGAAVPAAWQKLRG